MIEFSTHFSEIFNVQDAILQKEIPCKIFADKDGMKIIFSEPLFEHIIEIEDFLEDDFKIIAPSYAGGSYIYNNFARISLINQQNGNFVITDLSVFYPQTGWIDVIADSKLNF